MRAAPVAQLVKRLPILRPCRPALEAAVRLLDDSLRAGGKMLVCGNGGSAADSEHLVADLMKGFMLPRPIPADDKAWLADQAGPRGVDIAANLQGSLASISLGSQGALTTAIANDIRFDMVFAQQVNGLGRPGDILFAISTSGDSGNVVNAAIVAKLRRMRVVALTGRQGGELAGVADVAIRVPADRVYEIQELHLPVCHALALALELSFFAETPDDAESEFASLPVRASESD